LKEMIIAAACLCALRRGLSIGSLGEHVEPVWAARRLSTIRTEEVAHWRQHMLSAGVGSRTVHNSLLMLSFLCKHARRFNWIPANPCAEVRKPKFRVKVRAFTAAEVAILTAHADDATRVLIQTAAHTGLRIGELAGLEWSCVDLEKGEIHVEKQFTHEAWADLKTVNSRRRVPIARELLKELTLHRARIPGLLVFPGLAEHRCATTIGTRACGRRS
jgi:integrase